MPRIVLNYSKDGEAVPDFEIEERYISIRKDGGIFNFSTSPIFDRLELGIVEGDIPIEDIEFQYNGKKVETDEYGHPTSWPEGYLYDYVTFLDRLIRGKFAARRN